MTTNAPRNRTLSLSEQDVKSLTPLLVHKKDLEKGGSFVNRTINEKLTDVLPLLPNQFADLIIIDPPYNLTKDFDTIKFNATNEAKYIEYLNEWLPLVVQKLKPTGSLYMCGDWRCTAAMQKVISQHLTILNRITWQRDKGRGSVRNWKNNMEDIWFAVCNPKQYYFNSEAVKIRRKVMAPYRSNGEPKDWIETKQGNYRDTFASNLWDDISIPFWSMPENTPHPTQKPEKLIAKLILASSQPEDIVFDPFLGSGTTSVVAKKLNRRYCGVEINTDYCLMTEKRLQIAEHNKSIQGFEGGVFWERNAKKSPLPASPKGGGT